MRNTQEVIEKWLIVSAALMVDETVDRGGEFAILCIKTFADYIWNNRDEIRDHYPSRAFFTETLISRATALVRGSGNGLPV